MLEDAENWMVKKSSQKKSNRKKYVIFTSQNPLEAVPKPPDRWFENFDKF